MPRYSRRAQAERLAQRLADRLGVALGHDGAAVVLGDQRQESAVVDVDRHAEPTQLARQAQGQRVGEVFEARFARSRGKSAQDPHQTPATRREACG